MCLGTRTKLNPPDGVHTHWAERASYRLETMLETINNLPNRHHMFSQKNYAIYVLDDYAVHLMDEVRSALLKRGYILIIIGGGVTGDIQLNDTHIHGPLKAAYRKKESALMYEKLKKDPEQIPSPDRDEIMQMACDAFAEVKVDCNQAFKQLFITNSFNGNEDNQVSDKIYQLVGPKIVKFRELLRQKSCKGEDIREMLKRITPPKGIPRKKHNVEGTELFDCDGEELAHGTTEDINANNNEVVQSGHQNEQIKEKQKAMRIVSLVGQSNDPDIDNDAKFLDQLNDLLTTNQTSKLFTPFMSMIKVTQANARRSLKKRIQYAKNHQNDENHQNGDTHQNDDNEQLFDMSEEEKMFEKEPPKAGEHWKVSNGNDHLFALVTSQDPLEVQYFQPSTKGNYSLNDTVFLASIEDFEQKIEAPKEVSKGRRKYFAFM